MPAATRQPATPSAAPASVAKEVQRLPVLLDIGPAVHQRAGLSRYAENLAVALLNTCQDSIALSLFYNRHSGHRLPRSLESAPASTLPMGQYPWRLSVLASQAFRIPYTLAAPAKSAHRTPAAASVYHATEHLLPYVAAPTVLTVHDLIFERFPEHHTRANRSFLRLAMPLFVRRADAIIAVSRHTRSDLIGRYRIDPAKVHVVYEGINAAFRPAPETEQRRIRAHYSPDAPYFLMVGTLEPRKNHAAAIHALAILRQSDYPHRLLIAGGAGWLFDPIRRLPHEMGLGDRVQFLGYVPQTDLPGLYSAADCFLLPSLYEGFGFPVLEAMACGAPVVCSNVSSVPEVAGNAALIVPPHDVAGLANAIRLVLDQPQIAARLRELGLVQSQRFRWETCAAETAQIYRHVAGLP